MIKKPQVLLIGNGINMAYGGMSWKELLKMIKVNESASNDLTFSMPLQAILFTEDGIGEAVRKNREKLFGNISPEAIKVFQRILNMGFDHILTANYSYELECACKNRETLSESRIKAMQKHTKAVKQAEAKYMLHTYNEIKTENKTVNKIWHIHGEARKPDSVILGRYYYGELLSRYITELKSRKNYYWEYEKKNKAYPIKSWLDAFILGDVYVVGFGMDFSEFDLWWLLNRKKREKASRGTVYFYEGSKKEGNTEEKTELLRLLGVQVCNLGFENISGNESYKVFYDAALSDIERRMRIYET